VCVCVCVCFKACATTGLFDMESVTSSHPLQSWSNCTMYDEEIDLLDVNLNGEGQQFGGSPYVYDLILPIKISLIQHQLYQHNKVVFSHHMAWCIICLEICMSKNALP
jgi:hypothetical protein